MFTGFSFPPDKRIATYFFACSTVVETYLTFDIFDSVQTYLTFQSRLTNTEGKSRGLKKLSLCVRGAKFFLGEQTLKDSVRVVSTSNRALVKQGKMFFVLLRKLFSLLR